MTSKALNVGNERSEVQVWPSDWLCTCGHAKDQHEANRPTDPLVCIVPGNGWKEWTDRCLRFVPIDNLTYVELKAKERIL